MGRGRCGSVIGRMAVDKLVGWMVPVRGAKRRFAARIGEADCRANRIRLFASCIRSGGDAAGRVRAFRRTCSDYFDAGYPGHYQLHT